MRMQLAYANPRSRHSVYALARKGYKTGRNLKSFGRAKCQELSAKFGTLFDSWAKPDFNETLEPNEVLCVVNGNNNIFGEINTFLLFNFKFIYFLYNTELMKAFIFSM